MATISTLPVVLLAIDVGRVTGFAWGRFTDVRPTCGEWSLPWADDQKNAAGARLAILENTLIEAFNKWRPSHVVMAQPFIARTLAEAITGLSLHAIVAAEAWRRGADMLVQPEVTVRKEILGKGRAKTEVMKRLALQWCDREGIEVRSDHAADAAVMWRWARDEIVHQILPRGAVAAA